jgi:hypothetical protein
MTSPSDTGDTPDRLLLITARLLDDASAEPGFVAFDPIDAGRPVGDDLVASGWELYVGDESDAELEDADNARLVEVDGRARALPAAAGPVRRARRHQRRRLARDR